MAYATKEQLAAKLTIGAARATASEDDLQRVLDTAAFEIDVYIGGPLVSPTDGQTALLTTVNLARAQDLWTIEGLPVGVIGLGGETPLLTPRDSFERMANMLAPLKANWGIA